MDVGSVVSTVLKTAGKAFLNNDKKEEKNNTEEYSSPSSKILTNWKEQSEKRKEERRRQEEETKRKKEEEAARKAEEERLKKEEEERKKKEAEEKKKKEEADVVKEAERRQKEEQEKLDKNSKERKEAINEMSQPGKASVWNTFELGWKQTGNSIKESWNDLSKRSEKRAEKAKNSKGFFGSFFNQVKGSVTDAADLLWTTTKTAGKVAGGILDVAEGGFSSGIDMIKNGSTNAQNLRQSRINSLLEDYNKEKNSVKEVATERMIDEQNTLEEKEKEVDDLYREFKEISELEEKVKEMDELKENGAVSGPEWETNYQATKKALSDKNKTAEEAWALFEQKRNEYFEKSNEHKIKEQETLPFTRGMYETNEEVKYYKEHFGDKVYKNEDGSYYGLINPTLTGDEGTDVENAKKYEKESDIRGILMNLETAMFQEMEGVRNQTESVDDIFGWRTLATLGFGDTSRNYDFNFDYRAPFLKNSDFLDRAAVEFQSIKKLLEDNYDNLTTQQQGADGNMYSTLDMNKVNKLLQANRAGLNKLGDEIVQKKSNTQYVDYQTERGYKHNKSDDFIMWAQENAAKKKDLIFSFSESASRGKTITEGPQLFSYSRAGDWINQSTDKYGVTDAIWRMFASNPGQTSYVMGSTYFAVFGKLGVGTKGYGWKKGVGSVGGKMPKMAQFTEKTNLVGYTGVTRWSSKMKNLKTAEEMFNSMNISNGLDTALRMGYGTIDEMLVSLPLDLGLSDGTAQDMWMNIGFNTLGGIGKISSAPEMVKFTRDLTRQSTPEARKAFFIEQTGLKELAETIDFSQDAAKVASDSSYKINTHIKNLLATDKNKAAFFMSQYMLDNIDNLKWEHADSIKAIVDGITEDGNIGTSLGKNRAKNIQNIINKANKDLEAAKDGVTKLSIQNRAMEGIRNEFKQLLDTFDSDKIKKFFDHDFSREKISQGFANIFEKLEQETGTSKEWWSLAYLGATNNNSRHSKSVIANLIDAYKKALVNGEVTSTKTNVEAVRALTEVTSSDVGSDLEMLDKLTRLGAQGKHSEIADILLQTENQFLKTQRKINKSEMKVIEEAEKAEKAQEEAAAKAVREAEKKAKQKAMKETEKARNAETLEEKGRAVLDYAKKISEDKELKEEIEKAKEEYLDDFRNDEAIIEEAESRGLTLDEFLEKEGIAKESFNYQQVIENYIVRKYFNVDYLKKRYGEDELQNIAERVFGTTDVERLNDIGIKDLYRIDMFEEGKRVDKGRQALSSIQDIFTSKDNIWGKGGVTLEGTYKLTDEEKKLIREKIEDLKPIFEKITGKSSTSKKFTDAQNESIEKLLQYVEKGELNKEDIEDIIKIISDDDDIIFNIKNSYVDYVDGKAGSDIRNPYKVFSDKVADYIKNPNEMRSVIKKGEIEGYDKNGKPIIAKEDKVVKTGVESKFTKNFDKDDKVERELEKIIETITDADVNKKVTEAVKEVEEAAVKMDMTNEGKATRGAYQAIIKGADEFLDFLEASEPYAKKSGLSDAVSSILSQINDVSTERRFLGSLGNIVQDMVEKATSKGSKKAKTTNRTVFKSELGKSLFDVIPEGSKTTIRNELKKVVTDAEGNISLEKVQDVVGKGIYKLNVKEYENMVKAKETDKLLDKIVQDRIISSMGNTKYEGLNQERYGKVAEVINRIAENGNELYNRLGTAIASKYGIDPGLFMDKIRLADAIDEVRKQNKRVGKAIEETIPEETIDIDEDLQKVIDTNMDVDGKPIDTVKNLTEGNNAEEKIALSDANKEEKTEKLTSPYVGPLSHHEKTLMKFGAVEEAANIMKQVSQGKVPETIGAEFLDNEGFDFLSKLLKESGANDKEYRLFLDGFLKAKKQMQGFGYSAFYGINHVLYNGSDTLKTNGGGWSLAGLLKSIPVRISSSMKSARTGGIIYDARTTLTKYIMESNPEEGRKIMQDFLAKEYLPEALHKAFNDETTANFLKATNTVFLEGENESAATARALMSLYDEAAKELRNAGTSERLIHDILNPILYNPMEYISGLGRSKNIDKIVANKTILGTVLTKYENQGNDLSEALVKIKAENEKYAKLFNSFSAGAPIRNKYAYEVGEAFGKYLDKIDSIPMGKEQFAEYLNKTLGHIVNGGDDVVRATTAVDNALYPIVIKAREKLGDEAEGFLTRMWDVMNEGTSFFSKNKTGKEQALAGLEELIKGYKLNDDETKEIIEVIGKSLDEVSEAKDERVIVNYLYDQVTKRSNDYVTAMMKSDEKFNPADVLNRKELQDSVMKNYTTNSRRNFVQELYELGAEEKGTAEIVVQSKNKASGKVESRTITKEVSVNYANKNRENLIKDYGFTEEEIKEIEEVGGIDLGKIVEMEGEIDPEDGLKYMLDKFINGTADYTDLMANEYVRKLFNDSLDKVFDKKNMKAGEEYFSVASDGTFILRQEGIEMNMMEKLLARFTTRSNVMNKDKESQGILERLSKVRKTGYTKTRIDFKKILGKDDLAISDKGYTGLETYLSMVKASINKLGDKINSSERSAVVQDIVNKVFFNESNEFIEARLAREDVKPLYDLMVNYKKEYGKMRQELGLGDHWHLVFSSVDFGKNGVDKLGNRVTGMWSYLSNQDIARLSQKYDKSKSTADGVNGIWKRFTQDILYNARSDKSDSWYGRLFNGVNWLSQKYVIARNYNLANLTKAGQQMASNLLHSNGIRASTTIGANPEVDKFLDRIQESTAKNFGFDLYGTEGVFGINKGGKNGEKGWQGWKNLSWGNYMQGMKKVFSTNALMLGDAATKTAALKSSLALAMDDIYRVGGIDGVREFEAKFDEFQNFLKEYDLKEGDFLDSERYANKLDKIMTPKYGTTNEEISKAFSKSNFFKKKNEMWNFYHNEYAPFMGKARNSMGVFFVMDDIGELGSIDFVDKNRFMFGLMKWAMGKTGEYGFDLVSEISKDIFAGGKFNPRGFKDVLTSPIMKRMVNEIGEGAHAMWEVEKMTNHEFTWQDGVKATVVPVAGMMMLFGDSLYKAFIKNYINGDADNFGESSIKFVKDVVEDLIKDRAFIYAGVLGTDIGQSHATASKAAGYGDSVFYDTFARTLLRKWYVNNPVFKFTHLSSGGYRTDASELINGSTILAELGLNQASSRREQLSQITEDIYNLGQYYYEDGDTVKTDIMSWIPVLSNFTSAGADLGILLPMLEERVKQSGAKAFLKSTASSSELITLIDKMEKNYIMNSKEAKDKLNELGKNGATLTDEEVLEVMFRSGKYDLDLQSWKTTIQALNKEDLNGKGEFALWYEVLPDDDKIELQNQFNELYQKWVVDKNKGETATTTMLDDFIKAASKYGGTMSMAGYMEAFMTGMKARLRKAYGFKNATESTMGQKGDDWLLAKEMDFSKIDGTKVGDYIEFATTVRELEKQMIVNNWDWISREKNVGIDLLNKYIENDGENGFKKYTSSISQEKNNLSKLWNIKVYDEIQKDQGLPGLIYPLAYSQKKAMDSYNLAITKAETPEEAAKLTAQFLKIQTDLAAMGDKYIDNPLAQTLVKVSLAAGTIPFADALKKKNPELLGKVVDIIGEKAINSVLNVLTDSPSVSVADAFELATGQNAHEGTGGKGRSSRIPSAKARENYVNKMLIPNYNRAKAAAGGGAGGGTGSLPKFTTGYARGKDGSIVATQNPVTRKTTTPKLPVEELKPVVDVNPLPVKEGRVIGGKYSARAIQNAKVYSRRIGR